ncbi:rna-directed dna polymerase from mobile element jockey-like [Willisornis vidua]|uniref:Rna-directed dna polymerase from mobile element jockey-like n=1 Tax=Willisornis vidua TaxID=1566151 RepID=A0ABQ9CQ73_9PASS|nr:rna-directed dna polymerase from mobile element jockey-like [Willisornis vidua]
MFFSKENDTVEMRKLMDQALLEAMLRHMENRKVSRSPPHDSTKGKSCLTSLEDIYNGVTTPVDKGRATGVIYPDFCKVFDMTPPPSILLSKLERDGFDG